MKHAVRQSVILLHFMQRTRKGKVIPVLLTENNAMKAYWGVEV
jgi:hypothetical protein